MSDEKRLVDPDFEGSIFEMLGYDPELCPHCGTHLHGGICLNACMVPMWEMRRAQEIWRQIEEEKAAESETKKNPPGP